MKKSTTDDLIEEYNKAVQAIKKHERTLREIYRERKSLAAKHQGYIDTIDVQLKVAIARAHKEHAAKEAKFNAVFKRVEARQATANEALQEETTKINHILGLIDIPK